MEAVYEGSTPARSVAHRQRLGVRLPSIPHLIGEYKIILRPAQFARIATGNPPGRRANGAHEELKVGGLQPLRFGSLKRCGVRVPIPARTAAHAFILYTFFLQTLAVRENSEHQRGVNRQRCAGIKMPDAAMGGAILKLSTAAGFESPPPHKTLTQH